jgi:hypothetical protein
VSDAFVVKNRAEIARAITLMEQAGEGFRVPLLRAAYDGTLSIVGLSGACRVGGEYLALPRPTVVLIGDDHAAATGPARWSQARQLLRWANFAMLHAAGGEAQHYADAVAATVVFRRTLIVEMELRHHAEWLALAMHETPRLKVLSITPRAGGQHPVAGAPAGTVLQ